MPEIQLVKYSEQKSQDYFSWQQIVSKKSTDTRFARI